MQKDIVGFIGGYKGVKLFYKAWVPQKSNIRIILLHGAGEYSEKYARFAEWFFQKGIDVFALDLRGHGRSGGAVCHVKDFKDYAEDLDIFAGFLDKGWGHKNTFLVSHSLGGLIAIFYAMNFSYDFKGIVLCSPCLKLKLKLQQLMGLLANIFSKVLSDKPFASHIKPRMATHDKYIIKRFTRDPLIHHVVTASLYIQMLKTMDFVKARAGNFTRPLLLLQAGSDKICDAKVAEDFYAACGSTDKALKLYSGFYHELLNDIGKEKVFEDIYVWITERR